MPGPIFLHTQTYARKADKRGNCVEQIIAEVLREPRFSGHVENPKPPRPLFGNPRTFRKEHDAHVAARSTQVRRKGKTHEKAIRQDRHTLLTLIASYPLSWDQIEERGEEAKRHHDEWERRTLAYVRGLYGDQLRVAVAHDDEAHPHMHFWALADDPGADAATLHPGKAAKREVEERLKSEGIPKKDALRAGNKALKARMVEWLDDYHEAVGQHLGMTRDGPKRRRLSRQEWQAEKSAAKRQADRLQRIDTLENNISSERSELAEHARVLAGQFRTMEDERIKAREEGRAEGKAEVAEELRLLRETRQTEHQRIQKAATEAVRQAMSAMDQTIETGEPPPAPSPEPKWWKAVQPMLDRVAGWCRDLRELFERPDIPRLEDDDDGLSM